MRPRAPRPDRRPLHYQMLNLAFYWFLVFHEDGELRKREKEDMQVSSKMA